MKPGSSACARFDDLICYVLNSLLADDSLKIEPAIPQGKLTSMPKVSAVVLDILKRFVRPWLEPDELVYFAYRIGNPIPMSADEVEYWRDKRDVEAPTKWEYRMAVCTGERGFFKPGLLMHDRSNVAHVYVSGSPDAVVAHGSGHRPSRNQPVPREEFFRAFPIKVTDETVGVVGLTAESADRKDTVSHFVDEGTNLSLLLALVLETYARRQLESRGKTLIDELRGRIAEHHDKEHPAMQVSESEP